MLDAWCLPRKLHLRWLPTCVSAFESFSRYDVRHQQLGCVEEAEQIEAGLRKLLAVADPDHVILRELKRLS